MAHRPLPSFSKILLHPSAPHLPLPQAFVDKHLENKIPENVILLSVNGGYSWRLRIEKVGENYCFVDGWNDVVEDSELGFGDFLVFWLVNPSTFKLSIFSPNGCQRDFPKENVDDEEDEVEEQEDDDEEDVDEEVENEDKSDDRGRGCGGNEEEDDDGGGDIDGGDGDPFFVTVISKYHKSCMRFPLEFAKVAGIDEERSITMKNLDGKEWPMNLRKERCHNYTRYYLSAGWSKFRRDNRLSEGDVCVIKFIRSKDKLCLEKVSDQRRVSDNQPAGKVPVTEVSKRPRGRPPRAVVQSKDDGPKVVKRPRGRPSKKKRGRPAAHVKYF